MPSVRPVRLVLVACLVLVLAGPAESETPPPGKGRARPDGAGDPLPPGAVARLGTLRLRQGGPVSLLAFAPDGKSFYSAGPDSPLRRWDPATGREVATFPGRTGGAVALSADGKVAARCDGDNVLHVWDTAGLRELRKWPDVRCGCVALSADGKRLAWASSDDGVIHVRDVATGAEVRQLRGHSQAPASMAFSPDGKFLASGAPDGVTLLWDLATGKRLRRYEASEGRHSANGLVFARDGRSLITAGSDGTLRVWDLGSLEELRQMRGHEAPVLALDLSADGKTLASVSQDGTARVWDAASGKGLRSFKLNAGTLSAVALSPDGKTLVSGDPSGQIRVWDAAAGKERLLGGPREVFAAVGFAGGGRDVVAVGAHEIVHWPAGGKGVRRLGLVGGDVAAAALAPDGSTAALARNGQSIHLYETAHGRELRRLAVNPESITCLAFSPDGRTLASVGGAIMGREMRGFLRLWGVGTGKELAPLQRTTPGMLVPLAFTPDGRTLMGGDGALLHRWELATRKERKPLRVSLDGRGGMAVSPDGRLLALPLGERIRLCRATTGATLAHCDGHEGAVSVVAFSPDGHLLASGGWDRTVRLWDAATGKALGRLGGHRANVHLLAFSGDGKRLVSGSEDTTLLLWDVAAALEAGRERPPAAPTPARLAALWDELASPDAAKADEAMRALEAAPREAVRLFRERLHPAVPVTPQHLAGLLAELDGPQFQGRERAARELAALDLRAEAALRRALARPPSAEVRRRVEQLLKPLDEQTVPAACLRPLRAVEVLEQVGTPEARKVLEKLAGGAADDRLTREAQAALARLGRRAAPEKSAKR